MGGGGGGGTWSSLAVQPLGLERRAALLGTLRGTQIPGGRNSRGTPRSRQELAAPSAPASSSLQGTRTQTSRFPPRTSFANCPVPPFPILRSSEGRREKKIECKRARNILHRLGTGFQAIQFQVEQSTQSQRKPNRPDRQTSVSRNSPFRSPTAHLITTVI